MREIVDENNGDTLLKVLCVLLAENWKCQLCNDRQTNTWLSSLQPIYTLLASLQILSFINGNIERSWRLKLA